MQASEAVKAWVRDAGGIVRCTGDHVDLYGRLVAVCDAGGDDIGRRLVREGYAVAYRRYGKDYVLDEENAKREQR